jgi:hypothetical protein
MIAIMSCERKNNLRPKWTINEQFTANSFAAHVSHEQMLHAFGFKLYFQLFNTRMHVLSTTVFYQAALEYDAPRNLACR